MKPPNRQPAIRHLRRLLTQVRGEMLRKETSHRSLIARLPPAHRAGARRLLDDAVIRRAGRERIEGLLRQCGFPFAFSEQGDPRQDLEMIAFLLLLQSGEAEPVRWDPPRGRGGKPAQTEMRRATEKMFGLRRGPRTTRIMVTLPPEAAEAPGFLRACLASGMDAVRVNCARDDADTWKRLITAVRREAKHSGRRCAVFMDLGGPKLRTGPVPDEPAVVKIRPVRDPLGAVLQPALVTFVAAGFRETTQGERGASLAVTQESLGLLPAGSRLWFRDARGLRRTLHVVESSRSRLVCECARTAYIVPGSRISSRERKKKRGGAEGRYGIRGRRVCR